MNRVINYVSHLCHRGMIAAAAVLSPVVVVAIAPDHLLPGWSVRRLATLTRTPASHSFAASRQLVLTSMPAHPLLMNGCCSAWGMPHRLLRLCSAPPRPGTVCEYRHRLGYTTTYTTSRHILRLAMGNGRHVAVFFLNNCGTMVSSTMLFLLIAACDTRTFLSTMRGAAARCASFLSSHGATTRCAFFTSSMRGAAAR